MKYVVSWKPRAGGSAADNEAGVKRSLAVFGKWTPDARSTFHQFVTRLDGEGGFAVIETDDPASVLDGPAKFGPFFEFTVIPVVDVNESIGLVNEAIEFRDSIS